MCMIEFVLIQRQCNERLADFKTVVSDVSLAPKVD